MLRPKRLQLLTLLPSSGIVVDFALHDLINNDITVDLVSIVNLVIVDLVTLLIMAIGIRHTNSMSDWTHNLFVK